jgi:hypothetical protein
MASFVIVLYLLIPVAEFAHAAVPAAGTADIRAIGVSAGSPCQDCPCSDEQGSHCCDSTCCSCAFHSPPVQAIQLRYAPLVDITRQSEPFWMLPMVYGSIYVPPQNQYVDCWNV